MAVELAKILVGPRSGSLGVDRHGTGAGYRAGACTTADGTRAPGGTAAAGGRAR